MSSYDIDYIKDLCRHERVTPPPCLEYLCENKPEKAILFLKRAGMLRKGLKNVARALNLDLQRCGSDNDEKWIINAQLDLEAALCREVPEDFCDPTCQFYPSRRVFEVLENTEIKAYREEDDVIFDVWLNRERLTIRLSQFQRGLQTLLWMANEPVYFLTLPRKTAKEIINAALKYFHKKAERLTSVETYKRGISLEGEETLDHVLEELRMYFFNEEFVRNERSIDKPFIINDKIYIAQDLLLLRHNISPKKLTRALSQYGIKTKQFRWGYSFFRAYEIPVELFESLKAPIDKIVQAGREERKRSEREMQDFLAQADMRCSVDELIEQFREELRRDNDSSEGDEE